MDEKIIKKEAHWSLQWVDVHVFPFAYTVK